MKDPHDGGTHDFATIEGSFQAFSRPAGMEVKNKTSKQSRNEAIRHYLHEKPYLREALRRSRK